MSLIDLHCHILPAIDDGALDLADTLGMARQAERDGIALVCATPHVRHDHDVRIGELPGRVAAVNEALEAAGLRVRVAPGAEVAETIVHELTDAELRGCTLGGGGRWILLEPAPGPLSERTVATVRALARRGLGTVLAHPERHPGPDVDARLRELAAAGALIQLTGAFVLDGSADWFVAERLVHVLGSDAHSSHGGRPVELAAALRRLTAAPPLAAHASWIAATAPAAVVAGRQPAIPY